MSAKQVEIKVHPDWILDSDYIEKLLRKKGFAFQYWRIIRRSIDARGKQVKFVLRIELSDLPFSEQVSKIDLPSVHQAKKEIIIVGAGPAGYFAALECIQLGMKPIVLDRGKDVRRRRRDLRAIQQFGEVNPHSNYCFGEGGAGTYSDGKLYTRSHKRGNIQSILETLVSHGANPDILVDAHPHIGSNKLPKIVTAIRETIEEYGGQVLFDQYVTDLIIESKKIIGVKTPTIEYIGDAVILATGHSARDIFELLHRHNIEIQSKDFALGVRIEHAQSIIDQMQYGQKQRHQNLPAASYRVACQVDGAGVFSFCMCPGGLIVPAATAPGEIVVNGMSLSRRDSPFANSGFVTEVKIEHLKKLGYDGVFAGMHFQRDVEQNVFSYGDGSQKAPAQRVTDFLDKKTSSTLNESSYIPGLISSPLQDVLPSFVSKRLDLGLRQFGKKMKAYVSNEVNIVATESRTSSPIRVPRHKETLMHEDMEALFPCGEGVGYAGGILSAAMDGVRVAQAVSNYVN